MRTRSDSKKRKIAEGLALASQSSVDKLLKKGQRGSSKKDQIDDPDGQHGSSSGTTWLEVDQDHSGDRLENELEAEVSHAADEDQREEVDGSGYNYPVAGEEMDDSDWENGDVEGVDTDKDVASITVEFTQSPGLALKKPVRRATAEEKELAELTHKVHLLCLLARGRLIDKACNDSLIQASLLSVMPSQFLKISEMQRLDAKTLSPLVSWFHGHFKVTESTSAAKSSDSALTHALATQEGSPEEITALSVALFRALKLTTRFVSVLDVVSLKPDFGKSNFYSQERCDEDKEIFKSPTTMVTKRNKKSLDSVQCKEEKNDVASPPDASGSKASHEANKLLSGESTQELKRKGDIEFAMQMEMAVTATAFDARQTSLNSSEEIQSSSSTKRIRNCLGETSSSSQNVSTAIGARKVGYPMFWAEVFCSQENLTGRWVHVDAVNAVVDGEDKVEAAAAACRKFLRYVVAFAGNGAKDVTRRYCRRWYRIAQQRINSTWWDTVLAPLRKLELRATADLLSSSNESSLSDGQQGMDVDPECLAINDFLATRSSIEDMELETRALTEPLPTNQQAYRRHPLYVLEKWLQKNQILHPKGPILGFCSGHPVYPRSCVKDLKSKEKWLRDGLQVKANERPAKVLRQLRKNKNSLNLEDDNLRAADPEEVVELYGQWQMEELQLPHAVDGVVPKNERGNVEVWSEKCIPHGTVHLRLPRAHTLAKRLEIDYAPAMVGFDFRNGRAMPVFDGIVVCSEFKEIILDAYAEEEERRNAEERKRKQAEALARWCRLVSSVLTRERLRNCYGEDSRSKDSPYSKRPKNQSNASISPPDNKNKLVLPGQQVSESSRMIRLSLTRSEEDHEHVFLEENETFDEESTTKTKRCLCGFTVQVEEL
ncbi:hypothetical protein MLD38_033780 [Melastoma candidum]|uniref:Uncharacterized protein n=1 Tax=Melastoma candidum TaxID=119954 RepID=A0ACB9MA61_9MYRT|nr:hypothetical protein MLD38_033780 [Melastoma candidum]